MTTKSVFQNVYLYKLLLNLVNISVYLIVGITSIINLVRYINYEAENKDDINVIGINSFACALCLLLITSEFYLSNLVFMYLKFLCTFIGRGLLFLLFGFMIYRLNSFNAGVTYYVTVIGLSFIILSFFPSISLMEDVRNNWSNFREYARDGSRSHYYASSPDNAQNHHDTSPSGSISQRMAQSYRAHMATLTPASKLGFQRLSYPDAPIRQDPVPQVGTSSQPYHQQIENPILNQTLSYNDFAQHLTVTPIPGENLSPPTRTFTHPIRIPSKDFQVGTSSIV